MKHGFYPHPGPLPSDGRGRVVVKFPVWARLAGIVPGFQAELTAMKSLWIFNDAIESLRPIDGVGVVQLQHPVGELSAPGNVTQSVRFVLAQASNSADRIPRANHRRRRRRSIAGVPSAGAPAYQLLRHQHFQYGIAAEDAAPGIGHQQRIRAVMCAPTLSRVRLALLSPTGLVPFCRH